MDKDAWALLVWIGSAVLSIVVIHFKQGRYLTEEQPGACLLLGPIALLAAMVCPASWFNDGTS